MKIDIRQKPPTASAIQVVQDYFAAFGQGNIDGVLAVLSDDVVWHVDGATNVSTVGLLRGRDRVKEWLIAFPANFIPRVFAIDRLFESGDQVIAIGRFRHTIASTGNTVGSDLAIRFTLHDGLIVRYQILEDSRAEYPERIETWHDLRQTLLDGDDVQREAALAMVQKRLNGPEWARTGIGAGR